MKHQKGFTLLEVFLALFIVAAMLIGPACWHYAVNAWLHFAGKPETFGWGMAILFGLLLAPVSVPLAVITYVAMLFLA